MILMLGLSIVCISAYSRDQARQVWAGLSIFESQVAQDEATKRVLDITTLHPEHPQSIAGLIAQAKQNHKMWSYSQYLGFCVSVLASIGLVLNLKEIRRKRIIEQ